MSDISIDENKGVVTIDLTPLKLIEKDGAKFFFDPRAEEVLLRWAKFKKLVEQADDHMRELLSSVMAQSNTLKVEGDQVKVLKKYYGAKYELTDPSLAYSSGFASKEEKYKVETKEIDRFIKENGEIPEGVKARDRVQKVSIAIEGESNEEDA